MEQRTTLMEKVSKVGNWFNPVGILTTIVLLVGVHLADRQMLLRHDGIIGAYETHGTPAVVTMKATYEERFRANDARLDKLEQSIMSLPRIESKLDVLAVGQAALKESLDEHKRNPVK